MNEDFKDIEDDKFQIGDLVVVTEAYLYGALGYVVGKTSDGLVYDVEIGNRVDSGISRVPFFYNDLKSAPNPSGDINLDYIREALREGLVKSSGGVRVGNPDVAGIQERLDEMMTFLESLKSRNYSEDYQDGYNTGYNEGVKAVKGIVLDDLKVLGTELVQLVRYYSRG